MTGCDSDDDCYTMHDFSKALMAICGAAVALIVVVSLMFYGLQRGRGADRPPTDAGGAVWPASCPERYDPEYAIPPTDGSRALVPGGAVGALLCACTHRTRA